MERDFLGVGGKDNTAAEKEAGFVCSSALHWPFSNKIPPMQQSANFKFGRDDGQKNTMFNHLSLSGFQPTPTAGAFGPIDRSQSLMSTQYVGVYKRGIHQFQQTKHSTSGTHPFNFIPANNSNETKMIAAVTPHSIPTVSSSPFFKVGGTANGSCPMISSPKQQPALIGGSTYASRTTNKPSGTAAQLTIFYGGKINVYEDIPLDKAQAIMFMAANCSSMNSNIVGVCTHMPVAAPNGIAEDEAFSTNQNKNVNQIQIQKIAAQACPTVYSPISLALNKVTQASGVNSPTDNLAGTRVPGTLVPEPQPEPSNIILPGVGSTSGANFIPRAIPQARKASLARFLEKRKERVATAAPYPPPAKSGDCTSGLDGETMTVESAHSSSKEHSWRFEAHKKSSNSSSSPSTKLEI